MSEASFLKFIKIRIGEPITALDISRCKNK